MEQQPDPGADVQVPDPAQNPFAAAFAQPGVAQPFGQPMPFGQPAPPAFGQPGANPFGVPMTQPNGAGLFVPVPQPPAEAAPQGFFGVPGAATPGMIQQPVQQPGQVQRPRPQG
jgi:hypothetical protein